MANRKISDLAALATPASGDYLPIVDVSEAAAANKNKRITIEELMRGIPDGTAGAPGIAFESDPNTGIYSPGADQIALSTSGTERLRITSAGLVGIGTSSPAVPLHVSGDGNSLRLQRSTYSGTGETVSLDFRHFASNLSADYAGATITSVTTDSFTAGGGAGLFDAALTFSTLNDAVSAERMRISSSGNVGIGTTSPGQALSVNGNILSSAIGTNYVASSSQGVTSTYLITDASGGNIQVDGAWPIRFTTNSNERARIDSSGRLLVGTSSESGNSLLTVRGNTGSTTGAGVLDIGLGTTRPGSVNTPIGYIRFTSTSNTSSNYHYASIAAESDGTSSLDTDIPGRLVFSTTADGASSPTERMRIASSGSQTWYAQSGDSFFLDNAAAAGTTYSFIGGRYGATGVGTGTISFRIWSNGDVQNTNNSYGALSDVKLKENIVDANSQWSDIKALQVRKYNFKEGQTHTQIGLVAQEVELVSPGLVSESPDRDAEGNDLGTVTKSVNYSVLYMKAVKALQEAMERIETLEQRLNDAGIN